MNRISNECGGGRKPKFIVDFMLGRLAKWLRIFGYDTLYADKSFSENIILKSLKDNRILITRNSRLSRNRALRLLLVESDRFLEQAAQIRKELKLHLSENNFFTRCTFCNEELKTVEDKESIKARVPQYVFNTQNRFTACAKCGRIYWAGTHYGLLLKALRKAGLMEKNANP
jgi:uncharacterized protein